MTIINPYTGEVVRGWCINCHQHDDEPAGEGCKNPGWHRPGIKAQEDVRPEVRLPYVED